MKWRRWFGQDCVNCDGVGFIRVRNSWFRDWECPDCNGTGRIPKASA